MNKLTLEIKNELAKYASKEKAEFLPNFFKTGKGQYGEGDVFIGVSVPDTRAVAKEHSNAPLKIIDELLSSKIHEERLLALLILVQRYDQEDENGREGLYKYYLKKTKKVNNWDLVDLSAEKIIGRYLFDHPKLIATLNKLAKSENLWERRISILSTYFFIKNRKFEKTLEIARILLKDKNDLIHKAVGWMLREVGNRDKKTEVEFLRKHYKTMPRIALRYAIEKFPENERKAFLQGIISA